jgi:hypothetical protein|nr:hypothetical protein RKHAN_01417 [Rhizobium sp. Khangiran2]
MSDDVYIILIQGKTSRGLTANSLKRHRNPVCTGSQSALIDHWKSAVEKRQPRDTEYEVGVLEGHIFEISAGNPRMLPRNELCTGALP